MHRNYGGSQNRLVIALQKLALAFGMLTDWPGVRGHYREIENPRSIIMFIERRGASRRSFNKPHSPQLYEYEHIESVDMLWLDTIQRLR